MMGSARPRLAKGKRMARSLRVPLLLALYEWRSGQCRHDIVAEWEWMTGEWVAPTGMYATLRQLRNDGLIRQVPFMKQGVLRDAFPKNARFNRCIKRYELTPRGAQQLTLFRQIMTATMGKALQCVA